MGLLPGNKLGKKKKSKTTTTKNLLGKSISKKV